MDEIQRRAEEALAMLEPNQSRQRPFNHIQIPNSWQQLSADSSTSSQTGTSSLSLGSSALHSLSPTLNRISWRSVHARGSRFPVHRLANDARELTAEEMTRFHNLIPSARLSVRSVLGSSASPVSIINFFFYFESQILDLRIMVVSTHYVFCFQPTPNASASAHTPRDSLLNSALDAVVHSQPLGSLAPASSIAQRLNALDNARPPSNQPSPQAATSHQLENYLRNSARLTSSNTLTMRIVQTSAVERQSMQGHLQLLPSNLSNLSGSSYRLQQQARAQSYRQQDRGQQRNRQQRSVPNDSTPSSEARQRIVPSDNQSLGQSRGSVPCQLSPRVQRTIAHNLSRNLSMIIRNRISQQRSSARSSHNNRNNPDPESNGN